MLQLRSPELSSRQLFDVALEMATLSREADVLFIVNDRVDIAIAADAHGVHLGQIDLSVEAARRIAPPDFLVGASAATVPRARRAMVAGADYLGSGAAFPSAVKPDRRVIGPEGVAVVQAAVDIPVFAIGGVGPDNADRLRRAGVTRMCVITALAEATDPAAVIARLRGEA